MKLPVMGKDQLDNNFFVSLSSKYKEGYFQEFDDSANNFEEIHISTLPMDFPSGVSKTKRKEIESVWIDALPKLKNIKSLSIRHRVNQDFFEAICKMKNLESLTFWTSSVEDITSIKNLEKLEFLHLASFSKLLDITPITNMINLKRLSIDNCFKIENYDAIGKMTWLLALSLEGDTFAPKSLMLSSLKPYVHLKNLKHLQSQPLQ